MVVVARQRMPTNCQVQASVVRGTMQGQFTLDARICNVCHRTATHVYGQYKAAWSCKVAVIHAADADRRASAANVIVLPRSNTGNTTHRVSKAGAV